MSRKDGFNKIDTPSSNNFELNLENIVYKKIVESSPNAIVLVNDKGIITLINSQTEKLFGYCREEIIGMPVEMLIPERSKKQHSDDRRDFIANPNTRPMGAGRDLYGLRKDGTEVPIEIGLSPFTDGNGVSVLASIIDITERKKIASKLVEAYETLQKTEKRYRTTLDSMLEGCQIIDFDGKYLYVNESAARHGKRNKEEFIGHSMTELYPEIENTDMYAKLLSSLKERKHYFIINEFLYPDGSKGWFELSMQPVEEGVFVLSVDITERKHAEAELIKLNSELEQRIRERTEQLEETNNELEAFSYSVSHDLRAPLRHIMGFIQLLKNKTTDTLTDESLRYFNIISDSASQMGQLIDDLLHFSKMSRTSMDTINIDFNKMIDAILLDLNLGQLEKDIAWKIEKMPEVNADYNLMRIVWINLITNAVKYSSKVEKPKIEIGYNKQNSELIFFIKDNGAGFDEKYADKLFGVFQRLHNSEEFEGNGIGLATVKRIISRHGGKIWAKGETGKGAVFYFSLKAY